MQNCGQDSESSKIYVFGGDQMNNKSSEFYNPSTDCWSVMSSTEEKREFAGAIVFRDRILVIGGCYLLGSKLVPLNSMEMFIPKLNIWSTTPTKMKVQRWSHGLALLDNNIYVTGGFNGKNWLKSVEMLDLMTGKWRKLHSMNYYRYDNRLVQLGGCLYCLGGFDGYQNLSSVERYDPREGSWKVVAQMKNGRCRFGAAVLDNRWIYAVGGFGKHSLVYAERFDPRMETWESIQPLQNSKSGLDLVSMDGLLYALGGVLDYNNTTNMVEVYNPHCDKWTYGTPMLCPRNAHSAVAWKY